VRAPTKRYPVEQMIGASSEQTGGAHDSARRDEASTRRSADMAFAATAVASSGQITTAATVPVISAAPATGRRSTMLKRPWFWILAVAVLAAVAWLVVPRGSDADSTQAETQADTAAASDQAGAAAPVAPPDEATAAGDDERASDQPATEPDASTAEGSPAKPPSRPLPPATTKGPGAARPKPRPQPTAPTPKTTAPSKPKTKDSQFGI
jgi:hypothetical protein